MQFYVFLEISLNLFKFVTQTKRFEVRFVT